MSETELAISVMGVPFYSARGLTQTLSPITQSVALARDVNGLVVDLSLEQFRKYASQVSCADQRSPAVDGVWPGLQVTVDCVAELAYPVGGSPQRDVVPGSTPRTEGNHVHYRPRLHMVVLAFSVSRDEYGQVVAWSLNLEEA